MTERGTGLTKRMLLPLGVQLHRKKDAAGSKHYLVNAARILPCRPPQNEDASPQIMIECLGAQMRPELVRGYNLGEVQENVRYFTWKNPVQCSDCGEYIDDYEYFYYEKRNIDKQQSLLAQYFCCMRCFNELLPTEGFRYPLKKLQKKAIKEKEKENYWMNMITKEKHVEMPCKRVPLNPDAYHP